MFVDLYTVVREAIRISEPGYGLKKVEGYFMPDREADLTDGGESIVLFEQWLEGGGLEGGDQSILDGIAEYNEEDCVATYLFATGCSRSARRRRPNSALGSSGSRAPRRSPARSRLTPKPPP